MKKMNLVLAIVVSMIVVGVFTSCTSKEEKLYGKIDAKSKDEKELIRGVQDTVFRINENLSLKEAVASNAFSKNIVWKIEPAEKKGAYIVSFEYDIEPIKLALNTNIYTDELLMDMVYTTNFDVYLNSKESIVSPIGEANMFTRFISGEILAPTRLGADKEMEELLILYNDYKEENGFEDNKHGFIHQSQVPDQLPVPFFDIKTAKFIGKCYSELSSSEVEFIGFSLLFDFSLPYLDNKEYKGVGMNIYDDNLRYINHYAESLEIEDGLAFLYKDKKIYELYPYACNSVLYW